MINESDDFPSHNEVNTNKLVETYWTEHNVTLHRTFSNRDESLKDWRWRNAQYFNYQELMPVNTAFDKVVLDFGCGPGYDLVGFMEKSHPKSLIGVDISPTSISEARHRLSLHGSAVNIFCHDIEESPLPIADASIDLLNCSGVLHHIPNITSALGELRRVLKRGGIAQIMVYNTDSLWRHLYVAYKRQILDGIDPSLDLDAAFAKSTDGPNCPVSRSYSRDEFIKIMEPFGFKILSFGVAVSAWEMSLLSLRYAAIMDPQLNEISRQFLCDLTFDNHGLPVSKYGWHAGIDGCYIFSAV